MHSGSSFVPVLKFLIFKLFLYVLEIRLLLSSHGVALQGRNSYTQLFSITTRPCEDLGYEAFYFTLLKLFIYDTCMYMDVGSAEMHLIIIGVWRLLNQATRVTILEINYHRDYS